MKVNQKLHQAKLAKWVTLLQDQASSGLPVKEWCAQNDVTIHAYYYWKRLAKEAYINSIIPEIVPLPTVQIQQAPSGSSDQPSLDLRKPEDASGHFSHFSPPGLCDSHNSRNVNKDPVPSPSTLSVSIGTGNESGIISDKAVRKISELIHLDNQFDDLPPDERLKQRQFVLKPKVDDFFAWVRTCLPKVPAGGATAKALNYCLNQESYLRVFLSDPLIPMDNNRAEQAIRPFTLGRKNWVNMYSTRGAQSSAVLYSLVETAKANSLNVYEYFDYLLTELSAHADDPDPSFIEDLLPWTKNTQEKCLSRKKA